MSNILTILRLGTSINSLHDRNPSHSTADTHADMEFYFPR